MIQLAQIMSQLNPYFKLKLTQLLQNATIKILKCNN